MNSIYDSPAFFDLSFDDETRPEADFLEAAARAYSDQPLETVLEAACGGGRLLVELARRGLAVSGFDISKPAVDYTNKRFSRRKQPAPAFVADMRSFSIHRPVDMVVNTFNSFRHLLTEQDALDHLQCVTRALRPGGLFVLGLHLLPLDVDEESCERWTQSRGTTRVTMTLKVLASDRRKRLERMRLNMHVRRGAIVQRDRSEFDLRMYTASQMRRLLSKCPELELCDVFDFWYDITNPLVFDDEITDTVFVFRRSGQ